jgi:hypothetical protein
MNVKYEIKLINIVELEPDAKLVTVQIRETRPGWFLDNSTTYDTTFTYFAGEWVGSDNLIVSEIELKYRLQECLVANEANSTVDKYISTL